MSRYVLVVQHDLGILDMFLDKGWEGEIITNHDELLTIMNERKVDLVQFTGGTDVNAAMYGQERHPASSIPDVIRDIEESRIYSKCVLHNIPVAGICRGSQFLCVMNGGHLKQHVNNHGLYGTHKMMTITGEEYDVTSTHHQMMQPAGDFEMLGWAEELADYHEESVPEVSIPLAQEGQEPEVVVWKKSRTLAAQYHPEYMSADSPAVTYYFDRLENILN